MSTVVKVEHLAKRYRLGEINRRMLYQDLQSWWARLRKKEDPNAPVVTGGHAQRIGRGDEFWALRDINFEIGEGESVGIIGGNGAGKSTLLKILSEITLPTSGRAFLRGRVASLLEVGTGFHLELTGRENVFLNGAILGMSRAEVRAKFDEIASFSGVEEFLDTPVKRYSSGMRVRLAFAVAAHLEPEILIIDEVLAVGDANFQQKCLGRMQDVSREGRTVLFVSHQMAAVQSLCTRGILLRHGEVVLDGSAHEAIAAYNEENTVSSGISLAERADRKGSGELRFVGVEFGTPLAVPAPALCCGERCVIRMVLRNRTDRDLRNLRVAMGIDNAFGVRVAVLDSDVIGARMGSFGKGDAILEFAVSPLPLAPGHYTFTLFCTVNGAVADWLQNAGSFLVHPGDFFGTGKLPEAQQGDVFFPYTCDFNLQNQPCN